MIRAGGDPPGFGPFIRPAARIGEEHTTWGGGRFRDGEPVFLELSGCVGALPRAARAAGADRRVAAADAAMAETAATAFDAVLAALRPGARAREVYAAWQAAVDAAGLGALPAPPLRLCGGRRRAAVLDRRQHGTGLRHDSDLVIEAGMSFHILSWLMGTGRGDAFVSDTVLVGAAGPELLTRD